MNPELIDKVQAELDLLEEELVDVDGKKLKPSQCYHFGTAPTHILFNTNCPDSLKEKVNAIISKYTSEDESRPQQS